MHFRALLLAGLAICLSGVAALATCPPIPFVFVAGQAISPTQLNTNFTTLRTCVTTVPGVFGPSSTTINEIASWDDTTGSLLKQGGPATISGSAAVFQFEPDNAIESQQRLISTASGTVATTPTDTNQMALVWLKQTGALIGGGVNRSIGGLEVDYNDTGTTVNNDSFTGVTGNCNLLGARPSSGVQQLGAACVGVVAAARGIAHQGGGLGTEQGEIHALNIIGGISDVSGSAPHDYYDVIGAEVNMTGYTGGTMLIRYGFNSIDFGNGGSGDSEQGSRSDAAYNVASVAGTKGWKTAFNLAGDPTYGGNAISATGTVLGSDAVTPTTVAQGIDLNNFIISGFAFRSPGGVFVVTGAGDVEGLSITANNGLLSDAATAADAVLKLRDTGADFWSVAREATTNDFIVRNDDTSNVVLRVGASTNVTSIGVSTGISIDATGGLLIPGVSTSVGSITGSLCFDGGTSTVIFKVGANCI